MLTVPPSSIAKRGTLEVRDRVKFSITFSRMLSSMILTETTVELTVWLNTSCRPLIPLKSDPAVVREYYTSVKMLLVMG